MFGAVGVFGGGGVRGRMCVDSGGNGGEPRAVFTQPMQQLDEERRPQHGGQRPVVVAQAVFEFGDVRIGGQPLEPRGEDGGGQPAQVLDQRELEHARPGPEFADGERRDALVTVDEDGELLARQPAVAVPQQFDRHGVDPRLSLVLGRGQTREFAIVGARQVAAHILNLRRHEVKVVEQPLGRRCDEHAGAAVVGKQAIALPQHARVVLEARKDTARPARWIHGEARRQRQRPFFQTLDAEQFVAEWFVCRGRVRWPQPAKHVKH